MGLFKGSRWVDGMYDYLGISDYVPAYVSNIFLRESDSISEEIVTTPDTITELPEETVSYGIISPGLRPSPLGRLCYHFMITGWCNMTAVILYRWLLRFVMRGLLNF